VCVHGPSYTYTHMHKHFPLVWHAALQGQLSRNRAWQMPCCKYACRDGLQDARGTWAGCAARCCAVLCSACAVLCQWSCVLAPCGTMVACQRLNPKFTGAHHACELMIMPAASLLPAVLRCNPLSGRRWCMHGQHGARGCTCCLSPTEHQPALWLSVTVATLWCHGSNGMLAVHHSSQPLVAAVTTTFI
jgi:hypothetical protein